MHCRFCRCTMQYVLQCPLIHYFWLIIHRSILWTCVISHVFPAGRLSCMAKTWQLDLVSKLSATFFYTFHARFHSPLPFYVTCSSSQSIVMELCVHCFCALSWKYESETCIIYVTKFSIDIDGVVSAVLLWSLSHKFHNGSRWNLVCWLDPPDGLLQLIVNLFPTNNIPERKTSL